ncbi:MAG: hypothetical protein QOI95_2783 [Acidimicrobiaceae bacterium]|jgi:hypothetical protein
MGELSAAEVVRAADPVIHDVGSKFMLHPETMARAAEQGYANGFAFYFAGRGGVLGDVDADVVAAAFGWFNPAIVRAMWDEGVAIGGARETARRYNEACAAWGRDHLTGVDGLDRFATLADQVASAADGSGLPLFAGWRAEPRADDAPGRAMQLIHVLREWRGALHLVGTTAAGLSPVEAILTNEGEGQAAMFGWTDLPDCSQLKDRQDKAQAITDRLSATVYERALSGTERAEFAEVASNIKAAVLT